MIYFIRFQLLLYFYVVVIVKLPRFLSMAISWEESKTHLHQTLQNIFFSGVKKNKKINSVANTTTQHENNINIKIQNSTRPAKSHVQQSKMYLRRNYFAICLAVRDDPDIVEWIEYHWRKGCSKFYIYDNYSNPPLSDLIRQYIDKEIVEYVYSVEEMKPSPQMYIYNQCFSKHKRKHRFIGFIDTDEFIVTANPSASIPLILSQYEQFGGLALSWMSFGSSGHIRRPVGGVIANYRWCFPNRHIKSIVNTKYTLGPSLNTHAFNFIANYSAVTTDGRIVPSAWEDSPSYNVMYINHYCTKSKEDFQKKKKRGGGAGRVATDAWFDRINRDSVHNCSVLAMPPPRLRP